MELHHYLFIFVITPLLFLFFSKTKNKTTRNLNLPPGTFGWPVLGETLDFILTRTQGTPEKFISDRMKNLGNPKAFKTRLLGEPMVVLCGPAGNKLLFSNENNLVSVWWPASVRNLLGTCLSTSSGPQAACMRKTVSSFVGPDMINTMDLVSRRHVSARWQGRRALTVFPAVKMFTFELACRLFMSVEDRSVVERLAGLFEAFLGGVISVPLDFPGTRFYRARRATEAIKRELGGIVRKRREDADSLPSRDLLSHLLDESGEFVMPELIVVNNLLMMLFAGHDTSSCAITMVIKALAEHPQVYEKVLREQNEIASSKEEGELLKWEDIQKMKYSWNVVSETLRLWPPVTGAFREALVDINYEGYTIPKGWKLYWNSLVTHLDGSLFPEENKFDPSRFEAGPVPYSFVPFGGGPRMCVGKEFARWEILVFLHNVVRRFSWELAVPGERIRCDPIPTPEKGLPIHIHPHK